MIRRVFITLIILAAAIWGGSEIFNRPQPAATTNADMVITIFKTQKGNLDIIKVKKPPTEEIIKSPLTIEGEARGNWYFEASFPIQLLDGNGKELAIKPAQAQGDWMTSSYVPFRAVLEFTKPATQYGTLVLKKDNPSGLPEHDDELRVPVRFR